MACRPGSVRPLARADGHPSRAAVADSLLRSTRELGRAALERSRRHRGRSRRALLTLLRVGFTEPPQSPAALVVSYTTVSPLPPGLAEARSRRRSVFCGTFPRVAPGRRYRPPCPAEPGPSSATPASRSRRGRPAISPAAAHQCRPNCPIPAGDGAADAPCRSATAPARTRRRTSRPATTRPHRDSSGTWPRVAPAMPGIPAS
jgi:hypothetical protein